MNIQRKNSSHHFRMQSEREQTLVLWNGECERFNILHTGGTNPCQQKKHLD